MKTEKLKKLLEAIPEIPIKLKWCHNFGMGIFQKELDVDNHVISTFFKCYQTGIFDPGDFFNAPTFHPDELLIDDLCIGLSKNGNDIFLNQSQKELLSKQIEIKIKSND